ncbi:MAG: hypothetical protein ACYCUW_10460 [bacterium]
MISDLFIPILPLESAGVWDFNGIIKIYKCRYNVKCHIYFHIAV